ncbi:MAG: iron-siderophore ABC transporter substrate-binding protein [Rubrobacteraceae bacterium]
MTKSIERAKLKAPPRLRAPEIVDDLTRREFLVGAGLVALAPGCGNDGEGNKGTSANTRTIEHKYGTTEISGAPERVVTVGVTDHDAVLAVGVKPVGVTEWFGERPYATWPWAEDELGGATPDILPFGDFAFERIAGMDPDLIIGQYTGMTAGEYETLSEIAPTVAQSDEYPDFETPWQVTIRRIGRAVGREERAEEFISGLEGRFAEVREEHPEFVGATMVLSDWDIGVYYPFSGNSVQFSALSMLGFETPDDITEIVSDPSYGGNISAERLSLYDDADVLVWLAGGVPGDPGLRAQLDDNPIYEQLDVAKEGRDIFLEDSESGENPLRVALSWSSVLSIPFILDNLVPQLASAIDGDPETEVESGA